MENSKQELFDKLADKNLSDNEKTTALISLSNAYELEDDYSEALKYASIALVSTKSPRADVLYTLGSMYQSLGNFEWAIKLYNLALSNVSDCEPRYYTWMPLVGIAQVYLLKLDITNAESYIAAAIIMGAEEIYVNSLKGALETVKKSLNK